MVILLLSLAPVAVILFYIYFRDKYEKEPWTLLIQALILGAFIALPVVWLERGMSKLGQVFSGVWQAVWNAFMVAAFCEEGLKMAVLFLLIWKNKAFNEKFDGIVYATFISLGFAAVENILYVREFGYGTGVSRAITAVPAHALFGISMGYYFGLARFYSKKQKRFLWFSFGIPFMLHGIYDFILMAGKTWLLSGFIFYILYLWITGFRQMKQLNDLSIYRNDIDLGIDFKKVREFKYDE